MVLGFKVALLWSMFNYCGDYKVALLRNVTRSALFNS
jgi:hypothetical protein